MEIDLTNRIKEFESLFIDSNYQNKSEIDFKLNMACDLLRTDEILRQNTSARFYQFLYLKIIGYLKENKQCMNNTISLLLKLIRNGSGVNKNEFLPEELNICEFLIEYLDKELDSVENGRKIDEIHKNSVIFILQYFCNLIQGNPKAFQLCASKWLNLAKNIINLKKDAYSFLFEHSCAIIYLCSKKLNNENKFVDEQIFLEILRKTSDIYVENNWSIILIKHLFKTFFLELIFKKGHYFKDDFKLLKRIVFLNILNSNLNLISEDFKYLILFFERLTNDFLEYFINNEHSIENTNELNYKMCELKLALISINDLLSENENESVYREIIQKYEYIVKNICNILNKIHTNEFIKDKFNKEREANGDFDDSNDGYVNLKLELIRLIGILVYENEYNRNIVQETKALISIIENVNIDMNNPFIREWSIVTLRHLYYAKEIKN